MTHGGGGGFVLRRPDGTPMSKKEVIVMRRGAFKWLPVLCSNDLVHGSWWMVWGSFGAALFALVPLIQKYLSFYSQHDDVLPEVDFEVTWTLLIFSGMFYGIGSLAFVRAFEEPPKRALFWFIRHFQTDELLGAWLFLFGTVPAIPYTLVFFVIHPSVIYLASLASAIVFVLGTMAFVVACYPTPGKERGPPRNYILPLYTRWFGFSIWAIKHLANDWLAGTWFFLWANFFLTIGSFLALFVALYEGIPEQIFIWLSSATNSFLFLIGSLYFVSGSYPHAQQFYYMTNRGTASSELAPTYRQVDTIDPETGLAIVKREIQVTSDGHEIKHDSAHVISPIHYNNNDTVSHTQSNNENIENNNSNTNSNTNSTTNNSNSPKASSSKSSIRKAMKKEDEQILIKQQIKEDIVKSRLDALMMDDDDHHDDIADDDDDDIVNPIHGHGQSSSRGSSGYRKI